MPDQIDETTGVAAFIFNIQNGDTWHGKGIPVDRAMTGDEVFRLCPALDFEVAHAPVPAGDLARAYSKATMTSRLTREMVTEARELLRRLGIPTIDAPGEGEAQAAFMAARGRAWQSRSLLLRPKPIWVSYRAASCRPASARVQRSRDRSTEWQSLRGRHRGAQAAR